jgi:hypothetical protein
MTRKFSFILFLFISLSVSAQKKTLNKITKVDEGLYFMYYDSSRSKSTILEFEKFIVLLEVPVKDEGGGARTLRDHIEAGEKALRTLKKTFRDKPLKYVIHSHWHPHSISSVKPFLSNGSKLVTTTKNFEKLREFVDSTTVAKYKNNIHYMDADSMVISDSKNKIVVVRFSQKDFPNTPTPDYLFSYLPRYQALHCGCMYNKWEGAPVAGKEILTGREEDVNKFLTTCKIKPDFFIRLNADENEPKNMIAYEKFSSVINNGIRVRDLSSNYLNLDTRTLHLKRDSLLTDIISKNIPASIFNSEVYASLRKKDFERALVFAQYQTLINPSDPNAWDTLGEVHYFMDNKAVAKSYEKQCRKIFPAFKNGGELVWQSDFVEYAKRWSSQ